MKHGKSSKSIQPYLNKLKVPERIFLENLLNEIYDLFEKVSRITADWKDCICLDFTARHMI